MCPARCWLGHTFQQTRYTSDSVVSAPPHVLSVIVYLLDANVPQILLERPCTLFPFYPHSLYCTGEPDQPCDQWGRVLSTQNLHVHPHRGNLIGHLSGCPVPTRCGDVWPGMVCPTCRYNSLQSCSRRCRCTCDGCAVGRV